MTSARRCPGALWRLFRGKARREDGQALIMVVGGLIALLAMAGFVIDLGHVYVAQRQLQTAVDAATLAAGQNMPDPVNAQTAANLYSMAPAGTQGCTGPGNSCYNAKPELATATVPIVKTLCITNIAGTGAPTNVPCQIYTTANANTSGYSCNGPAGPGISPAAGCNAVQVIENEKVNTPFLGVIGLSSIFGSVQSKSTVLMRGGTPHPLDVEIVLDVSGSMTQPCTDQGGAAYTVTGMPNGTSTKLDCAKEGIRSLISTLWPCDPSLAACPSPNTSPLDKVGLEIFPGVTSGVFTTEFDCTWTLTSAQMGYTNSSGYDAVPLSSDYRTSDTAANPAIGNLVGTSPLVEATSWSSCNQPSFPPGNDPAAGGPAPGNQTEYGAEAPSCSTYCTFFADALGNAAIKICLDDYGNAGCSGTETRHAQGVIILLSDGDANTQGPDACQVAVDAAQTVALPPYQDWVFSIAYDANSNTPPNGCRTDAAASEVQKITLTGTTGGTYTLAFNGSAPTGPIAYNATAATVQTALRALSTINGANVTVTGAAGGPYTVTFGGTLANQDVPQIVADGTNLVPSFTVAVTTTTSGSTATGQTPFHTMQQIASDPSKFFCLHPPTGQTCNGANAANLNQIFKDVGTDITGTRIIPSP